MMDLRFGTPQGAARSLTDGTLAEEWGHRQVFEMSDAPLNRSAWERS